MKKFYLFCNMGMSTSLLSQSMQEAANDHNLPITVKAFSFTEIDEKVTSDNPDVILLGPQIGFRSESITKKYSDKPVGVIDSNNYGLVDGEAVLKQAIYLFKTFSKGEK